MIKFGTGGWRAIIGDEFIKHNIGQVARALAYMIKEDNAQDVPFCIGYDRRFLSDLAAKWCAEVLAAYGIKTLVVDREAPTPLIMFVVKEQKLNYGMVITASHNPAIYNGIKVFTLGGRDADENATARIEQTIARLESEPVQKIDYAKGIAAGLIEEINPINEYIDSILASVDTQAIRDSRLKIALDPMYGVSQTSLKTILMTMRCEVEVIHERHDTLFGGKLPAPNEDTMRTLSNFVKDHKCDIGVATDGDADRIGLIDDQGQFVHPNKILVLLYYYLVKYKGFTGPAVRNNSTSHMLDKVAQGLGSHCYEVPVGFKHISSKMIETDAIIGGESSGGLTVRGHIQGKDGIYAATLLVEMITKTGLSLSALYEDIQRQFGKLYIADLDFTLTEQIKQSLLHTLFTEKKLPTFDFEIDHVSYLDGCKVYFKNGGWIICRFSGTEPLVRLCCEMPELSMVEATLSTFCAFLNL